MDGNLTIDHDPDSQGEHGSHVAGIAAANSYIPGEDGYVSALESVKVQGVAPEAQLLVMKVFGAAGGAYDSDYMAAIEDAIVLGADSINLSLGSGAPGYATDPTQAYQDILNNLVNSDAVVTISAGNSGGWAATAVENGAAGVMIYNNTSGIMAMDLTGYEDDAPCVSIRQADADVLRQNAQAYEHCYVGKLTVAQGAGTQVYNSAYYTMSVFSSWGVPGSLTLKPELTTPGGSIYSVNGAVAVSLTAQNAQGLDVASHNGKLVVRYDSANLTLTGVQGAADYLAYADDGAGRLVIAYAGRESIPAGAPVATLTFSARNNAAGTVQVLHQETDDALNGSFTETLTLGGDHSHLSLTYVPAQAASCAQDGHVEYWFCAACGRYFADAQAQKELTYAETVIPATGHSFTTVDAKAANCTEAGNISYRLCGSCGAIQGMDGTPLTKADVMLPALGHVRIVKNAKGATETEEGYSDDIVCARCGETLEKGRTLPKTNGITLDQALNAEGGSLEFRTRGQRRLGGGRLVRLRVPDPLAAVLLHRCGGRRIYLLLVL